MSIRFLKQLPTNDSDKGNFAYQAIQEVLNGEINPLEAFAMLKHIEDVIGIIKADEGVKRALNDELDKYGKTEKATSLGYQISMGERKNWDYSVSNDVYLDDLLNEAKVLDAKVKERTKFLQTLKQKMFDSENGGFEILPPIVSFTTYPILKAVKQSVDLSVGDGLAF